MATGTISWERHESPFWAIAGLLLRPLHLALAFPSVLYVMAMTVFLFRPPDLFSFSLWLFAPWRFEKQSPSSPV